jgi:sugar-specific transcriptional regulator TrmB
MYQKELQELGLDKKEAAIYLATLELGEATAHRIAKKSGIKRASVYRIIDGLKEKGLMSAYKKKDAMVFYAENPKKLKEKAESNMKLIDGILPGLLSFTNLIDKKPKIKYYDGNEEIQELYLETLKNPGQEIVSWSPGVAYAIYGEPFWEKEYIPTRIKNKIPIRLIYANMPVGHKHKEKQQEQLRQVKFENSKNFKFGIQIKLFGGKYSAFISNEEMMGIIIESQKTYDTLKSIFEVHWKSLEK